MPRSIRTDIEQNDKIDFLSKPILRTNPKLSTNIKLVVADKKMYLESFDATDQLSDSKYKKYVVKPSGDYSYDVSKFWNRNKTPNDLLYTIKRSYSDLSVLDSYDKQFEEFYNYGTKRNFSKLHDYEFRMFAPIWLDKNIPSKFLIYRVDEPLDSSFTDSQNLERINEMLASATLIKTVDLSNKSDLGTYLRKHVENTLFPKSPLTVSFEKGEKTQYNGIDLIKGGFVNKGEYHYKDTIVQDLSMIDYNKFITNGFERNSLACANLINLEFLFDDENAEDFSINRYFGIYVDEKEIGEGIVESIKNDVVKFESISTSLQNLVSDYLSLPISDWYSTIPFLGWAKGFTNYHNIKNGKVWDYTNYELGIDSNGTDYSDFIGVKKTERDIEVFENNTTDPDFLKIEVIGNPIDTDEFSLLLLKRQKWTMSLVTHIPGGTIDIIGDMPPGISITAGATELQTLELIRDTINGTVLGTFAKYTATLKDNYIELIENDINVEEFHNFTQVTNAGGILNIKQTYTPIKALESTFAADTSLDKGRINGKRFSANGSFSNIASAISDVINENTQFTTLVDGATIYIKSPINGYNKYNCAFFNKLMNTNFLSISAVSSNANLNIGSSYTSYYDPYPFSSGSDMNKSVYIKEDDEDQISIGDYLLDKNNNSNRIIDIVEDSRTINTEFKKLILQNKNQGINGISNVYETFKMKWGLFGAYDIYDMNFDFYDTINSDLDELQYEIGTGATGATEGSPYYYPGTSSATVAFDDPDNLSKDPYEYYAGLLPLLSDEKTEDTENEIVYTEFERLQENNTTDHATESRLVPFINKWSLKDSMTVREKPYYLNVNETFGEYNFGPDFTKDRDPKGMTHDWFYLYNYPLHFEKEHSNSYYSYSQLAQDIEMTDNDFKSVDFDYFKTYFASNGSFVNDPIAGDIFWKTQLRKKYTIIDGGSKDSFASTVFKGIKFIPKIRKKQAQSVNEKITNEFFKNTEFNGYRFSTVLKSTYESNDPNSISLKVIQNKKFKFIVFLIEVNLSDFHHTFLNRKLLYELDHALNNGQTGYRRTQISGALALHNVTLTPGRNTVMGMLDDDGNPTKFRSQILKDPTSGQYGRIGLVVGGVSYILHVADVVSDTELVILGQMLGPGNVVQPTSFYTSNQYMAGDYSYSGGGIFAHDSLLSQLSIKQIFDRVNNEGDVEYYTVNEDGTIEEDKFVLEIDSGVEVIKTSNLTIDVDTNKPKSFSLTSDSIGFDIINRSEYYSFLNRHNGGYTVDMRPIVTFTEPFSKNKIFTDWGLEAGPSYYLIDISNTDFNEIADALYSKFNGMGTSFNVGHIYDESHDLNWGKIKNQFFHKVNEINTDGIIKLSESDDLPPKYNLINEIAIDKRDINIFKSRWENNYYIRSLKKGEFDLIPGTKNIIEEKSYAGSASMKFAEEYNIFNFTINQYEDLKELNEIKVLNNAQYEVNFIENDLEIIADFYLTDSATRKLDGEGIRRTFKKYVQLEDSFGRTDTIDDDVTTYIEENILPLFTINKINLYVLTAKKIVSGIDSSSSIDSLDDGGYELDGNFTYELDSRNPLNFRLIYNKKKGYSHRIRPLIKIKS